MLHVYDNAYVCVHLFVTYIYIYLSFIILYLVTYLVPRICKFVLLHGRFHPCFGHVGLDREPRQRVRGVRGISSLRCCPRLAVRDFPLLSFLNDSPVRRIRSFNLFRLTVLTQRCQKTLIRSQNNEHRLTQNSEGKPGCSRLCVTCAARLGGSTFGPETAVSSYV